MTLYHRPSVWFQLNHRFQWHSWGSDISVFVCELYKNIQFRSSSKKLMRKENSIIVITAGDIVKNRSSGALRFGQVAAIVVPDHETATLLLVGSNLRTMLLSHVHIPYCNWWIHFYFLVEYWKRWFNWSQTDGRWYSHLIETIYQFYRMNCKLLWWTTLVIHSVR